MRHPSTPEELDNIMLSAGRKLVAVDFGATWCPPCKMIKPFFESLSSQFPDVIFVSVDIDQLREHPLAADIMSVPTFKFFIGGNLMSTFSGAVQQQIVYAIQKYRPPSLPQ